MWLEFYVPRKPSLANTIFDHIIFEMFRCQSWSFVQLTNYLCLVQHDVSMHPLWVGWFKSWPRLIWSNTKNWMVCMRNSKVDSWWRNEVSNLNWLEMLLFFKNKISTFPIVSEEKKEKIGINSSSNYYCNAFLYQPTLPATLFNGNP